MSLIESFIESVQNKIADGRYYYSQGRENEFAVDCSWLLIRCLKESGIQNNATFTGDMEKELIKTGKFVSLPFSQGNMKRGDILLRHISQQDAHAVLYLGNNTIAEACNKRYGLRITNYYANRYQKILRIQEGNPVAGLPLIKKGSNNIYVGFLQLFLNKYENARLVLDMEYGSKTAEAVKNFQAKYNTLIGHSIEIDGETGAETWQTIYTIMERS